MNKYQPIKCYFTDQYSKYSRLKVSFNNAAGIKSLCSYKKNIEAKF